jgi:hypothetical protein
MDESKNVWPASLMIRDTQLHDDMGGGGQRIYTTAGRGYERVEYTRADMAGWRSIQTAPKDGSMILLYNLAHNSQQVMGWSVGFDDENFPEGCWTDSGSQNKAINTVANGGYFQFWMPLPPPPITTRKD